MGSLKNIWLKRLNGLHVRSDLFLSRREIGVQRRVREGVQVSDAPVVLLEEVAVSPIVDSGRQPRELGIPHRIGHLLHLRPIHEGMELGFIDIRGASCFTVNRSTDWSCSSWPRGNRRWRWSSGRRRRSNLKGYGLLFWQWRSKRGSRSGSTSTFP